MSSSSSFQAFLIAAQLADAFYRNAEVFGDVRERVRLSWTLWIDPGVHTGLAAVVYASMAGDSPDQELIARNFDTAFKNMSACGWRGEPGIVNGGLPDLCSAALVAVHTELLTGGEIQQVRTAMGRVRRLGEVFAKTLDWSGPDVTLPAADPHLGPAGVGAETFMNLRPERDRDYLSPVRVRSMFGYALDDEFGIEMDGQQPGDAKHSFSDIRMKAQKLYIPGPDHVRDALAHCLLAIRRNG